MSKSPSSYISREEALRKLRRYCAYQERCHAEVRQKLRAWNIWGDSQGEVIAELITEGFLNEERFARTFARGKFRMQGWGRLRIEQELKQRQLSDYCIRKGLEEIGAEAYRAKLDELLHKKRASLKEPNAYILRQKLYRHLRRKGYEPELIGPAIDRLLP